MLCSNFNSETFFSTNTDEKSVGLFEYNLFQLKYNLSGDLHDLSLFDLSQEILWYNIMYFLVYYVLCSYHDEILLYSEIISYSQSKSTTKDIIFIFLRWSPHFISLYTSEFLPSTAPIESHGLFPILHLLPVDIGSTKSFNEFVLNYEREILSNASKIVFSEDVRIIRNLSLFVHCHIFFFHVFQDNFCLK